MADVTKKIQEALIAFDMDCDGKVSDAELIQAVRACGVWLPPKQEEDFVKKMGGAGVMVPLETAEAEISKLLAGKDPKQVLTDQFKKFDRHNDGTIKAKELEVILNTIGELLTQTERGELCKLAIKGNKISYIDLIDKLMS